MGMVAHAFNPCNQEAEAGAFLWVPSHGDEGEGEKGEEEGKKLTMLLLKNKWLNTLICKLHIWTTQKTCWNIFSNQECLQPHRFLFVK